MESYCTFTTALKLSFLSYGEMRRARSRGEIFSFISSSPFFPDRTVDTFGVRALKDNVNRTGNKPINQLTDRAKKAENRDSLLKERRKEMIPSIWTWTAAAFLLLAVIGYALAEKPRIGCGGFLLGAVVLLIAMGLVYYFIPVFVPVVWGGLIGFAIGSIIGVFF